MSRLDLTIEQQVLRSVKALKRRPQSVLLGLSGGVDSLVMAEILFKWRQGLGLKLAVAHVHHGPSRSRVQTNYRQGAQEFARDWAAQRALRFHTNLERPPQMLHSEQALREWREKWFTTWRAPAEFIALGHHRDDLLETRLIRLIRGAGAQGLRAMSVCRLGKFRPLLGLSAAQVRAYAAFKNLTWLEDPSNAGGEPLRNWLRRDWLPQLEGRTPGAVRTLARSLENLVSATQTVGEIDLVAHVGLRREGLASVSLGARRELLARFLKSLGLNGYTRSHVDEILKRLATRHSRVEFEMLGLRFQMSPDFLWASRV